MKAYPLEDIKAPAYLYIGNSVLFIKDNIKVQKQSTLLDVAVSHNIKAGDILTDQSITIKASPVAFSNTDALFKELSLVKGARIPKVENCAIVARVASGKWVKWSFAPAIHDRLDNFRRESAARRARLDRLPRSAQSDNAACFGFGTDRSPHRRQA